MAFQFVPNADGSFDEGMRQTNPETGVEYIFTDGAWRPLGPKIEDQFDELDERYVQSAGDTIHGTLKFDHGDENPANLLIRPNISDTATSVYALNNGALRFRSLPAEDTTTNSTTHIAMGKTGDSGAPETYIYHLQDPQDELWAANKRYVDTAVADADVDLSGYLPLTGGTLTGELNLNSSNFVISKEDTTQQFKIKSNESDYFVNLYAFNADEEEGGMRLRIAPENSTSNYKTFIQATFKDNIIDGQNHGVETQLNWLRTPTLPHHAANKNYVDSATKKIPPGLRYRYRSQTTVNAGQMAYYSDGGNLRLRISNESRDLTWNNSGPIADIAYGEGHLFTIYYIGNSGNWNIIRQGTINRIDWHSTYILCYVSSHQTNGSFGTDRDYYVTISGIC